jgi:hypothetical protein
MEVAFGPNYRAEQAGGLESGIALKGVKKKRNCFWLKKRAGRGRNQTGSLEIQMYASF